MHPILANRRLLLLYLAAWIPLGGLLAGVCVEQAGIGWGEALFIALPLSLVHASVSLSAWYICRALPLQRQHLGRLAVAHAGAAAVSSTFWLLLGRAWLAILSPLPYFAEAVPRITLRHPLFFFMGMLVFLFSAAVHYLILAFQASREAERVHLEIQVLARDAELRALRTQIDPHFLFNSLHSISALVKVDPAQARQMCLLLAELLRRSLRLGAREAITLDEEMKLVREYLEIERLRFGERLHTKIHVDPGLENQEVPPLLLQPLVENSITHGIAHRLQGGHVHVEARSQGSSLLLTVENARDPASPRRRGVGTGLENVRKRLRLGYGGQASLRTQEKDESFRVEVTIPLGRPAGDA